MEKKYASKNITTNYTNEDDTREVSSMNERRSIKNDKVMKNRKMSLLFIGVSLLCIITYIIFGTINDTVNVATSMILFVFFLPMQVFIHVFFTNAIRNESYSGIAGYDSNVEYDRVELKKYISMVDLHVGILSTIHIFLLDITNLLRIAPKVMNVIILVAYVFFVSVAIILDECFVSDKIYVNEEDVKTGKKCVFITSIYLIIIFFGMGMVLFVSYLKKISNNTLPAINLALLCLLGIAVTSIGFALESASLKKWNQQEGDYKIGKRFVIFNVIAVLLFACMFFVQK